MLWRTLPLNRTAALDSDWLAVVSVLAGDGVAEARDGLCTVCHVRLRPQIFNEVRRNDGLHQCDSCTRILYFVPVPSVTQQT